ncbi:MAG: ATP synthase F1 subunit delta [Candidatus Moraniibacteriota bacterium]|jgi:F-type H+-transporting ATPase subunit delta
MKVSAKQYANTLYELTDNKSDSEINDVIVQFVEYMKKTGDLKKSQDVVNKFGDIYNDENNIIEATVVSARELTAQEQSKIQSFIKEKYSSDSVVINSVVDKEIKGGIIIKIKDEVLDGSVLGRLRKLKISLK